MRVKVMEAINQTQGCQVNFSTEYGNATALWSGNEPQINKEYFVELEVSGVLGWQKDINVSEEKCGISLDSGTVHLVGLFESIEDDGYTVIRLGDSIISIETQGEPPDIGSNVKLTTNNLLLYEVNY
jgi:hypothetical protein